MPRIAQCLRYLRNQVNAGYNPICVVVGKIRVGKSWFAGTLAQIIQPLLDGTDWDVEKQLFIDFDKFLNALDRSTKKVLIYDEAGYSLGSKEWYSKINKGMNMLLQTQGFRANIIIIVLPMVIQLAKDHRRMLDIIFHVEKRGYSRVLMVRRNYEQLYNDTFKIWRLNNLLIRPSKKQKAILKKYDLVLIKLKKAIPRRQIYLPKLKKKRKELVKLLKSYN